MIIRNICGPVYCFMRILFHANRFPYPPFRGDKLKIYNLCNQLKDQHELHLLTFLEDEADLQYLPELQKIFHSIHLVPLPKKKAYSNTLKSLFSKLPLQVGYFQMSAMHEKIDEVLNLYNFDAVHIQHVRLAPYWSARHDIKRILDMPDAFSLYWQRRVASSKGVKKIFNQLEYKRMLAYEQVMNQFDLSLVCSKEDLNYLRTQQHITTVQLLPNGVDTNTFTPDPHDYNIHDHILFTGNMDYAPNVDAVIYFVEEIFPIILKSCPKAKFTIAGQRPLPKVKALDNGHNIAVTGFIEDIAAIYTTATVVVAPLRFGAGTQNKVLEAMAKGVPVVSRNIGFEGLDVAQGEGVFLKMSSQDFADQCIALLQDEHLRKQVGERGQEVIVNRFAWPKIAHLLGTYFEQLKG